MMKYVDTENKMHLTSIKTEKRPGRNLVVAGFIFAWAFAVFWYILALGIWTYSPAYSILIAVVNTAFVGYLIYASNKLSERLNNNYSIIVEDGTISLNIYDQDGVLFSKSSMDLDACEQAEYYRYQDNGSILMKSKNKMLDLPVWCLPDKGKKLVTYLRKRNIPILMVNTSQEVSDKLYV